MQTRVPRRRRGEEPPRKKRCLFHHSENDSVPYQQHFGQQPTSWRKRARTLELHSHLAKRPFGSPHSDSPAKRDVKRRRMFVEPDEPEDFVMRGEAESKKLSRLWNRRPRPKVARKAFGQRQRVKIDSNASIYGASLQRDPLDAQRNGASFEQREHHDGLDHHTDEFCEELDLTQGQPLEQEAGPIEPRADVAYADGNVVVKITEGDFERYIAIPAYS